MKDWFKYKYGFVNIDDENIYFTSTGNWTETKKLQEKGIQKSNKIRKIRIQTFLVVSFVASAVIIFTSLANGNVSLLLLFGLPIALFSIYNYLKTGIGENYKLPIHNIISITIADHTAMIEFTYLENKIGIEKLERVEEKGKKLLESIMLKK
ncbi:MAG: hypothetical protein V4538_00280 [Bacteroidota bacterium]